jgi:hypothetical protein
MTDVEYVTMPVPKHLLPAVMAFVAGRMGEQEEPEQHTQAAEPAAQGTEIKQELVVRMWNESGSAMRKALKALAAHPGSPVASTDLSTAVFGTPKGRQLSGVMGAFGHRCSGRYAGAKPFSVEWNVLKYRWEYTMTPQVAKWIRDALAAADRQRRLDAAPA